MIDRVIFMRKLREKAITAFKTAVVAAAAFYCTAAPERTGAAAAVGISRCITVVIPSLYAMMIIAPLLVRSGIIDVLSRIFELLARIFGLNGREFAIFLFSQFAGYPTGVRMLCGCLEQGSLSRRRAGILSGLCFGAGPAFISGCISSRLYGSLEAGRMILISAVSANLILLVMFSVYLRFNRDKAKEYSGSITLSGELVSECVSDGGRTMGEVCFAVIAFAVMTAALRDYGVFSLTGRFLNRITGAESGQFLAVTSAIMDITAAADLPRGEYVLLPLISGLVSFGGICVFFQLRTISAGKISLLPAFVMRIAAGILSGAICSLIMPPVMVDEIAAAAAIQSEVHQAASPVPSVLLIVMTVMLIKNAGGIMDTSGRASGSVTAVTASDE